MIHTAKLYARFSDPDGKYPRVPVKFHGNGKAIEPKPPAGSRLVRYQIRVAGKFIGVGDQFDAAVSRLRQEEARLRGGVSRDEALAVETPEAAEAAPQNGPVRIVDAANEFIREMRTLDRKRNSVLIYANALRDFQKSCRKQFMNEIDRKDILNFMDWMKENMQVRVPGS